MPNRILKPSIITSKSVNALTDFQFRLWIHLIATADDFGRSFADPKKIRNLCFPCRGGITVKQVADSVSQMAMHGIIRLYEKDGESFLYFPNWDSHQRTQQKRSKYPEPTDSGKEDPNSSNAPADHSETQKKVSEQQVYSVHPKKSSVKNPPWITVDHRGSPWQEEREESAPLCPPSSSPPAPPVSSPPYNPPKEEREEPCTPGAQAHVKGARWDYPDDFEQFWAQYPKKTGKGAAYAAWRKQRFTGQQRQLVMASLARHKASYDWTRDGGQYIPNPATWLNQARFQDEPRMQAPQKDDKPSFNPFYDYVKAHEGGDPF